MKKIPLAVKIIVPIMVIVAACGVYFGIKLADTNELLDEKEDEVKEVEAIDPPEKATSYSMQKEFTEYDFKKEDPYKDAVATYEYGNTMFVSYSESWYEKNLIGLKEELYSNIHGDEINYLNEVVVHENDPGEDYFDYYEIHTEYYDISTTLFKMLPKDFYFILPYEKSSISIEYANSYKTPEEMAYQLAHEYGNYFTQYYFNLIGDPDLIKEDPYFKLRYDDDYDIRYLPKDFIDEMDYYGDSQAYLYELAAADYVYLMGSPNTKKTLVYMDTKDILRLDLAGAIDELNEYYSTDYFYSDTFNRQPHENILVPLPDQIEGLAELFYSTISLNTPIYKDRSEKSETIELKITKESERGISYYLATWNQPWEGEDVTYTLVAYDEENSNRGAIKSVTGDEKPLAMFGGATLHVSSGNYFWYYDSDDWLDYDKLTMYIIVTFDDGTAVISPSVDWSQK